MRIFILEDDANRIGWFTEEFGDEELVFCNHATPALDILAVVKFDVAFLDHDLGGRTYVPSSDPNTGYRVAQGLAVSINRHIPVIIHSFNPDGAKNIRFALKNGGHLGQVAIVPFSTFDKTILSYSRNKKESSDADRKPTAPS